MRLLEFRHNAPARARSPTLKADRRVLRRRVDRAEHARRLALETRRGLRVAIAAAPQSGVIPGAVVGIAIDVFNDGTAPAPESKLFVSLPLESRVPGRHAARRRPRVRVSRTAVFDHGLPIARLPGETSSKVTLPTRGAARCQRALSAAAAADRRRPSRRHRRDLDQARHQRERRRARTAAAVLRARGRGTPRRSAPRRVSADFAAGRARTTRRRAPAHQSPDAHHEPADALARAAPIAARRPLRRPTR